MNLTRPPLPSKPPREPFYAAVHELHKLDPEPTACAFAEARFGPVRTCEAIPTGRGLYALECTAGRCYVALVGVAEIEGRGLDGSAAVRQREQLLIAVHGQPAALEREILVTPRSKRSELRRAYVGYEALGRQEGAWVVADHTELTPHALATGAGRHAFEWSTLALASGPLRRYLAPQLTATEHEVYEYALFLAREHYPEFVAELLPYPPSAYQAALEAAIAETPARARAYAREVVRATLSGQRRAFAETPGPRSSSVTAAAAALVRRRIDATVNQIRHQHLPCGTEVAVVCWEDERIRPGTVVGVEYGASAPILVNVDYPDGYRSPRCLELINPSAYPLSQIKQPVNPLHALAQHAGHEPLEPRRV